MEDKMDTVLNAYADAYPDFLVLKFMSASTRKYFPSATYVPTIINKDFVENQDNRAAIIKIMEVDAMIEPKVSAFVSEEEGIWGYFKATDVDKKYVTTGGNKMTINFKAIQGIEDTDYKKTIFHRVLTMMYAQVDPDDADNYFFDPSDHIENAANLTDTVSVMVGKRVDAA